MERAATYGSQVCSERDYQLLNQMGDGCQILRLYVRHVHLPLYHCGVRWDALSAFYRGISGGQREDKHFMKTVNVR